MTDDAAPTPSRWSSAAFASGATALTSGAILGVFPGLMRLGALDSRGTSEESARIFVVALGLGGLAGATRGLSTRRARVAGLVAVGLLAGLNTVATAARGTLSSGAALMSALFLAPVWLIAGVLVALLTGLGFGAIAIVAGSLGDRVRRLGGGIEWGAAVVLWIASFIVLAVVRPTTFDVTPSRLPPPVEATSAADKPHIEPCEEPPFRTSLVRASLRAVSEHRVDNALVELYVVGQADWTDEAVENEARMALVDRSPCSWGGPLVRANVIVAKSEPVKLSVSLHEKKASARDAASIESILQDTFRSGVTPEPDGMFSVDLKAAWRDLPPGVVEETIDCKATAAPDLTCDDRVVAFHRRGVVPSFGELKLVVIP